MVGFSEKLWVATAERRQPVLILLQVSAGGQMEISSIKAMIVLEQKSSTSSAFYDLGEDCKIPPARDPPNFCSISHPLHPEP